VIHYLKRLVPGPIRNRLRSFRWSPGVVHWLPGSSVHFGPPRRWMHLNEYFAGHPGELREAIPAYPLPRPRPELVGNVPSRFLESFRAEVPPAYVFRLSDARLLGAEGWIAAPGDTFLLDASYEGNVVGMPMGDHHIFRSRRGFSPAQRRLPGRCLSLASDYAIGGFGHFIHDSLTRILLVEKAGLKLSEFDWIYLPRMATPAVRELVTKLEIEPERLLNHDVGFDLSCEDLTATSFPGAPGSIASIYAEFLRSRFAPVPRRRDRLIYLSRHGFRRNFSNLKEVEDVLQRYGFEEVRPHEDKDTIQKCAEAAFVFCIEGANFFNATFCPVGTGVVLVFPDRLPHCKPYAFTLAEACGFRTIVISGDTVGAVNVDGGIADLYLDPNILELALKQLMAG
jgi:hypothetical protein